MYGIVCYSLTAMIQTPIQRSYFNISEAASVLGVSVSTLRNWDRQGKLTPRRHPINGYRIYERAEIMQLKVQIEGKA